MDETPRHIQVSVVALEPHALIYSTIMLMVAYSLFDEGPKPLLDGALLELIAVGLASLFALSMAHLFTDALDTQILLRRRLTGRDRIRILLNNLQYMYVAIPAILILLLLAPLNWAADAAVGVLMLVGLATLFFWGTFAARKAGLSRWRQLSFGLSYGFIGILVLLVELALTH
ncbi:MAG: hypothetical protein Q7K25_10690 [Actinomycetota bacterium]|nr:hypothetical protein [Actinomycetota bacterium]